MRRISTILLSILLLWLSAVGPSSAKAQEGVDERQLLKAAFIYNFAKLTHWPDEVMAVTGAPLKLCTVGNDPLIGALARLGGTTVQGHTVTLSRLDHLPDTWECHLLYIADSERDRVGLITSQLRERPVLTVSSIDEFARSDGVIGLYRDGERIRFRINMAVARDAGLSFSSRLLKVGDIVNGKGSP